MAVVFHLPRIANCWCDQLVQISKSIQKENNPAVHNIHVGILTGFAGMMGRGGVSCIRILEELKLHVRAIARIILDTPLFQLAFEGLLLACCFYCPWFSWTYFQKSSIKQKISSGAEDWGCEEIISSRSSWKVIWYPKPAPSTKQYCSGPKACKRDR